MITDGHGNVLAGGERGGKSHITYKPYGEIFRTDSYGPDITKFKYTGQEKDQESGLCYYKARYYNAAGLSDGAKTAILAKYYLEKGPKRAVTPIDKASREHDSDDPGFFHGLNQNINADTNWIKNHGQVGFLQIIIRLFISESSMQ
ncbi:RHS repeat-associated core domain protein [Leptospira wolbachii serovar Codice str. CDC]|uniref:RHS repeat-associated core domain protein n=1 Tax=Leptospira wolbachii serovar Codice str. CDC TaxID=1218599 RepID=R9A0V0_9LEPT|nr:RHS repeat-associated core domain-containing protein [Leptospira wolbachii]EOQ95624.1 RHS repeat-associated core domain protein [Leptospira wolbachii serovar Codice str. CDC]